MLIATTAGSCLPLQANEGPANEALLYENTNGMERITVTASRAEQRLMTLDSNLSVVSSDEIGFVEHEHINQLLVRVPGGWVSRGNGQEHLTAIRSPVLTGAGGCGAFYVAQDGISVRAPGFCNVNQLFDVNSEQAYKVEVLRGPASTLYGSNAVHGVINVLTPEPKDGIEELVGVSLGPHEYKRGRFQFGGSQNDHAFMVYGNLADDGGYKTESGFEQQKLNLIHQYDAGRLSVKNVFAVTNLEQQTAGFIKGEGSYKDEEKKKHNPNPEAYRDNLTLRAYSQIDYALNLDSSFRVTPYLRHVKTEFLQHFLPWQPVEVNEQTGLGVQSQYDFSTQDLNWLVGLDLDLTQGSLTEDQPRPFSPSKPQGFHYDYDVEALVLSPFVKGRWQLQESWSVSAGLRFDYTSYDYSNNLTSGSGCAAEIDNCRFSRPESQEVEFEEFSYQLGSYYALNKNHHFYTQISTGYRAPQATELFRLQQGQLLAELDAEHLNAFELGLRGQTDNLFYDVSAFSMVKDDVIFQDTDRQNISGGKTSHKGIEFTARYQWSYGFYAQLTGTMAKHEYDSAFTLSRDNIKGNDIDTAPKHMGSMQFGWQINDDNLIELEWVHLGKYYLDPENKAVYPGHDLLNLRITSQINQHLTLSARVLNLTDDDYAERADFGFGSYRYFVGEPRSIFFSLNYLFD